MKKVLFLEGNRTGYTPEQCGRTMTVGDLIEFLQAFDEELPVYIRNDGGYTYGKVSEWSLHDDENDEEEEWNF